MKFPENVNREGCFHHATPEDMRNTVLSGSLTEIQQLTGKGPY